MSHLELDPVTANGFLTICQAVRNIETTRADQSIDRDISLSHTPDMTSSKESTRNLAGDWHEDT